jgi:hypothetical protein
MRSVVVMGMLSALFLAGCDDGPAERAGEKIDRAVDKLSGKGPAERAGERIDKAVDEVKKN